MAISVKTALFLVSSKYFFNSFNLLISIYRVVTTRAVSMFQEHSFTQSQLLIALLTLRNKISLLQLSILDTRRRFKSCLHDLHFHEMHTIF